MKTVQELADLETGFVARLSAPLLYPLDCLIYLPTTFNPSSRLLVAVHGISREAQSLIDGLVTVAEDTDQAVIAPIFDRNCFPAYQRIIDTTDQIRPDWLLNSVLMLWQRTFRPERSAINLFGFSGGAQFCHRYAYLNAHRIENVVLASAGWYTLPDETIKYPYGLKKYPRWLGNLSLKRFVSINFRTLVGSEDLGRDTSVRQGPRIDALQGVTRLERAQSWCNALAKARQRFGLPVCEKAPLIVPELDHDLTEFIHHAQVQQALISAFTSEENLYEHQ